MAVKHLILGALVPGAMQGTLTGVWASNPEYWSGKFPFMGFPVLTEYLPPVDNWVTLCTSAVSGVALKYGVKGDLANGIGNGILCGATALFLFETIRRITSIALTPRTAGAMPLGQQTFRTRRMKLEQLAAR